MLTEKEVEKNVLLFVLVVGIVAYITTFVISCWVSAGTAFVIYTFDTGWAVGSMMVFLYTKYRHVRGTEEE